MNLTDALHQAEALARTIRTLSDGKIDLTPQLRNSVSPAMPPLAVSWGQAQTEGWQHTKDLERKALESRQTVDRTKSTD